ncbi:beta-ketoacyl synthase chain length factor [Capnocytophaga leadbetteri]|uniref:beta-ketoacyl synthase chain length factor n=1 Tax=Capnocytophaga leadbetteri TaxID=327575 RepID=UPI0026ED8AD9|nr:beta-ketoacyl synthase chain length factor [Capnocytophaga leadbetteri]
MKIYINGASCLSAQPTFPTPSFDDFLPAQPDEVLYAQEPSYKDYIAPNASRRMAKGVKMSIATATEALREANITTPEAIIVGTGMGCVQDSEKFLKAILDNQEQHLTPTAFIQSTHNTVAGQLALHWQCHSYNTTYVNGAISFESALLDATMQLEQQLIANALVGGVDEHAPFFLQTQQLVKSNLMGEGAAFFALSAIPAQHTYAELVDISLRNEVTPDELPSWVTDFLQRHTLSINDIDIIFTGDPTPLPWQCPILSYKNLCGEYFTASAFGLWYACHYLKEDKARRILLINSYNNKDFSLVLVEKFSV